MPKGYSGAPAIRYFNYAEDAMNEAHSALNPLIANTPAIAPPAFFTVPYTSSDATFQPGETAGSELPENIIANYEAYDKIATEDRFFGQESFARISEVCTNIENIVNNHLILPYTCAQVRLVTQSMRALLPGFRGVLEAADTVSRNFSDAMGNIAGGGGEGFEVNRALAEGYRQETESAMNNQVNSIRAYATRARGHANSLDIQADGLIPELSATRRETGTNPNGTTFSRLVADLARRAAAIASRAALATTASTYRGVAETADTTADNLETDITYCRNYVYENDIDDAISCDAYFAGKYRNLISEVRPLVHQFEALENSFNPNVGIVNFAVFESIVAGNPELTDLKVEALVAAMQNGEYGWELMREIAGQDILSYAEALALAYVYLGLNIDNVCNTTGLNDLERFFGLFAKKVELSDEFGVVRNFATGTPDLWEFNVPSLRKIQEFANILIYGNYFEQRHYNEKRPVGWESRINELREQRNSWAENLVIMRSVTNNVGRVIQEGNPHWVDLDNQFSSNTITTAFLSGDGEGPTFNIRRAGLDCPADAAFTINFNFIDKTKIWDERGMPAVIEISHQYSGTTWLSNAITGGCIIDLVNLYKNEAIQNRYRFCERNAIDTAIGNIFMNTLSMPLNTPMKFALMVAKEMKGISDERDRLQGIRNDFQEFSDYVALATAVNELDLLTVVEHNNFGEVTVHTWRRLETEAAIENMSEDFVNREIGGSPRAELFDRYLP